MAAERVPELNEGGVVEHLSTAITLVPLIQCEGLERDLSNYETFRWGPNLAFFGLGPWQNWQILNFDDTI